MEFAGANSVPVIYADDIGEVESVGNRVRITYIEFRRVEGKIIEVPAIEVIRPLESVGSGKLIAMVDAALKERVPLENAVH